MGTRFEFRTPWRAGFDPAAFFASHEFTVDEASPNTVYNPRLGIKVELVETLTERECSRVIAALADEEGPGDDANARLFDSHQLLNQLVHELDENHFVQVVRVGGVITDVVAWTDSGMTMKIRQSTITRTAGLVTSVATKQFNDDGDLRETLTATFTRALGVVTSVDVVRTV